MNVEETEILVVGAGPAGLIAAREAARRGAEVTAFEEDQEIGFPCHCAGLLSLEGLRKLGVPADGSFVQNRVRGARFFSPSGLSFIVERSETVACVVDRGLLDRFLARQAADAGTQIMLNLKVHEVTRAGASIVARAGKESATARILIDAEGVSSGIVRALGLKPLDPSRALPGLQFDLKGVDVDPSLVEVHTGRQVAPNFFAWVIPLAEDSARVGLACKGANPRERLEEFVKARFGDSSHIEQSAFRSGLIVTSGPIEKTFDDNLLVVGDAAGQVKPTTGGGVILGGICASIAGEVASEALHREDFTTRSLGRYESLWKKRLGKEFKTTLLARKVVDHLGDEAIDKLFRVIIKEDLQNLLSAEGDMDFQRNILMKLVKKKEVLKVLPSLCRALIPF